MTPGYYETLHADGEPNAYLLNFTSDDTDTCNAIFEKLLDMSGVATTSRMRDTQDTYMHSMERVDFVVVIIILAAAALAMVVLFNLSNINIPGLCVSREHRAHAVRHPARLLYGPLAAHLPRALDGN